MKLEANAKINIGLLVGARRPDGFHSIKTIMALISLSDSIDAEISDSEDFSVRIHGNETYLESGIDLMEKAAEVYHEATGLRFSLAVSISKHIPAKAGLGGGSADAAAILRFLDSHFGNYLGPERLLSLSAAVGSDVPFLTSGYSGAFVSGRGDVVEKTCVPHGSKLLVFFPRTGNSTGLLYDKLDKHPRTERQLPLLDNIFPSRATHPNDFELVSSCPLPENIMKQLAGSDAYVSMTGSGSAWIALFPDDDPPKFDNPEKCDIVSAYII